MQKTFMLKKKIIKKISKISVCILMAASIIMESVPLLKVEAAKTICATYPGTNIENQNYSRWATPIKSYLTAFSDGTFMRVQYGPQIEGLLVEYYDKDYNITSSKMVKEELSIFGGFYATDSNYFVVTGQTNTEESDTKEVYRITKYDRNWNKIKSAGLRNCNTTIPFDAGSCRMDTCGKYLIIRTSHEMYTSYDGKNHQANVTIELDMDTMAITDSYTGIMDTKSGYVSHSFNQFIKTENNKLVAVDHGDAYPRSIVLLKYRTDVSTGKFFCSSCTAIDVLNFPGAIGENTTGASVGGFEISDSKYLVTGNSVIQDNSNLTRNTRNVFVASIDKSTSAVNINWLTSYREGEETTSTPQMVKVSNNKYIILWSREDNVYYTSVDGNGVKTGETYSLPGNLSDCVPVVSGNKLVWYTWNENVITFYDINVNDLSKNNKTEIMNGHRYENKGVTNGVATLKCAVCQQEEQVKVITSMTVYWNDDGGNSYSTRLNTTRKIGDKLYYWIQPHPTDVNTEMEIISSNPSIVYITRSSQTMGVISIKGTGTAKITIRPKYNPDYCVTYNFIATESLKINSFTVDKTSPITYGDRVCLSASAIGGLGTLQYKFYETMEDGTTKIIRNYSSDSVYQWKPDLAGVRTLYVDVKDSEGTVRTASIKKFVVNKANAPNYDDIIKNYCYSVGADSQSLDIKTLLPENRGLSSYDLMISDSNNILSNVSVSAEGILRYHVKNTGKTGNTATIAITIQTSNYTPMTINVQIVLVDKKTVVLKTGSKLKIKGSNELTYGQKISTLTLDQTAAEFVTENGENVTGILSFENPDFVPEAGTTSATWIFIPSNQEYSSCTGTVDIAVNKATPDISGTTSDKATYVPNMQLSDIALKTGIATADVAGKRQEINGTWKWKTPNQAVQAGSKIYTAIFIPNDSINYNSVEIDVAVTINRATPLIAVLPSARTITYGQSLKNSLLENGIAKVGDTVIEGIYQWQDDTIQPTVLDSQKTQYSVVFVPNDIVNYTPVLCKVVLIVNPIDKAPNMPDTEINVANSISNVRQIELPQGWSWAEADVDKELIVGKIVTATAVYKDRNNYKVSSVEISIFRSECNHIESEQITDVEATCTVPGKAHTQCVVCGAILRKNIEIPLISHNYGNWKYDNQNIHIGICQVCGDVVQESHAWNNGVVAKNSTAAEEGITIYTCLVCGCERMETIEKLKPYTRKDNISTIKEEGKPEKVPVKINQIFINNKIKYKITKGADNSPGEVSLVSVDKNKKSVTVPATVTFNGVKYKVTSISTKAFSNSKKLKKVVIGKNIKSIKAKAFYQCTKLKNITIKSRILRKVGKQAVKGIHKKAVIKVPKKKAKIYKKLLNKKSGFTKNIKMC